MGCCRLNFHPIIAQLAASAKRSGVIQAESNLSHEGRGYLGT